MTAGGDDTETPIGALPMTGAPQPLLDALNNLQADADGVTSAQSATNAQHALTAAQATLAADLAAFEGQLQTTYGGAGAAPPPPAAPAAAQPVPASAAAGA